MEELGRLLEITAEFERFETFDDLIRETPRGLAIELSQPARKNILEHLTRHILNNAEKQDRTAQAISTLCLRQFMAKFGPTTSIALSQYFLERLTTAKLGSAASAIIDNVHIPYGMRKEVIRNYGILQLQGEPVGY